jgi:hypothetical protein
LRAGSALREFVLNHWEFPLRQLELDTIRDDTSLEEILWAIQGDLFALIKHTNIELGLFCIKTINYILIINTIFNYILLNN